MLEEIYLYQFRNLATMCLALDAKHIILVGQNGAGKSNFLEAIYYACLGSSFRERQDEQIVHFEKHQFALKGIHRIDKYFDTVNIQYQEKRKEIFLNKVILRDRKELLMRYPCVIFGYHDSALIHGEPSLRRQFFDQMASLVYGDSYILSLRAYQHLLKQRNLAFKNEQSAFIASSDGMFVQLNADLMLLRRGLLSQFNAKFTPLVHALLDKTLEFSYKASFKERNTEEMLVYLQGKRAYEWSKKSVLFGVHRDRYLLMEGEREIASYLSVGERRMVSLVMKQVLAQLIVEHRGRKPIILLDDVFVELDNAHRERFWQMLPDYEQLFMSAFSLEPWMKELPSYKSYRVVGGEIEWMDG
ncbi:DNA replication/repair protein RecF [Entomospira culicis]|uniref:DNA replication and repair protein RecF n=1 Tax=Entomospira culicis TaxID=2719989 RepID=A0A968KVF1_9SPIO|nr:DNA replication and repair protein RecF [Entomospira culicis]NIZ19871.1 DNA replication/repair protein RecF [Entomospira culicis]NIZ70085.1 DNA replication/repair protein RecF [Entomospira culicis]WDI37189.1 DNA replication and repair protein RecF [Entomospira culicis]WDI38818.1 DNA replication and repair protein RecF [Entomospira culicis]